MKVLRAITMQFLLASMVALNTMPVQNKAKTALYLTTAPGPFSSCPLLSRLLSLSSIYLELYEKEIALSLYYALHNHTQKAEEVSFWHYPSPPHILLSKALYTTRYHTKQEIIHTLFAIYCFLYTIIPIVIPLDEHPDCIAEQIGNNQLGESIDNTIEKLLEYNKKFLCYDIFCTNSHHNTTADNCINKRLQQLKRLLTFDEYEEVLYYIDEIEDFFEC